jgi:putative endonuclease
LAKRIAEHQAGTFCGYTSKRLPVRLVFLQEFSDVRDAISAERQIKGWSRKKKEALIQSDFRLLHKLSQCRNKGHYSSRKKTAQPKTGDS